MNVAHILQIWFLLEIRLDDNNDDDDDENKDDVTPPGTV